MLFHVFWLRIANLLNTRCVFFKELSKILVLNSIFYLTFEYFLCTFECSLNLLYIIFRIIFCIIFYVTQFRYVVSIHIIGRIRIIVILCVIHFRIYFF